MKSLNLARRLRRQKVAEASGNIATAYFGPEIDAGYSYGKYTCASCGFEQLSNKGEMIHCVNCGAPSKLQTTASFKAVKKVTKNSTSEFYCPTCGSFTVSSSADAAKDPKGIHCPQCGSAMEMLGEESSSTKKPVGKDIDVIEDESTAMDEEGKEGEETLSWTESSYKDIDVIEDESTTAGMEEEDGTKSPYESSQPSMSKYGEESYDTSVTGADDDVDIEIVKDDGEESTTAMDEGEKEAYEPRKGTEDENEQSLGDIEKDEDEMDEETSAAIEIIDDEESDEKNKEEEPTITKESAMVEYISPLAEGSTFTTEDIQMAFYAGNNDPSWTVLIKGSPVATIKLSDQPRAQEIAEIFTKDEYAQNVAQAIVQCGPKEVLDQVKARYFASKIEQSALATQMYDRAKAELAEAQRSALATMKEEFKTCIATVLAGMNKNFWKDTENPLKGALFAALHDNLGISDPTSIIESAFEVSANTYFDIVLSKAIDFMGKTSEAREEIAQAISGSNAMRSTAGFIPAAKKLAQRLESNNIVAQVTGNGLSGKDKSNIKNIIRLGKSYN